MDPVWKATLSGLAEPLGAFIAAEPSEEPVLAREQSGNAVSAR